MTLRHQLLEVLADGRFHSGQALGDDLRVSRAAVWKQIQSLKEMGLELHSVPGRGYRLAEPLELLRAEHIRRAMSAAAARQLAGLEVHLQLDSTNNYLRKQVSVGLPAVRACVAECQSAGRGRRDRAWISPFGGGLYLSLLWFSQRDPADMSGVSLVVGLAVLRAFQSLDIRGAGLKWPNDIMWGGGKLGGVLLDISGESGGPCSVVIGVGINVRLQPQEMRAVAQPWVDLYTVTRGNIVSRNQLAGALLEQLITVLQAFQQRGLEPFLEEWRQHDLIAGHRVQLTLPDRTIAGTAQGIDADGSLVMNSDGVLCRFTSGEVSLRVAQ